MKDKKNPKTSKEVDKIEDLQNTAAANLAGWQKALADYQNMQKEMEHRLATMKDFVSAEMIADLLPIFDNYRVAIEHIPPDNRQDSWAVGLEHILKMWDSFLVEHQISKIESLGQKFDPNIHESVGQLNDKDKDDQIILEEKLAGYKNKDKVIRPAKVIINNIK